MQCKARYCREKKELRFPLKSGYFTELRCPNLANEKGIDSELCDRCHVKAAKPFSPHCQQGQYQGKVDEPYFEGSWIFGSDRFEKYQKLPGNALPAEEYARAEAAQKIARQGSEMKEKAAEPKIKHSASAPTLASEASPKKRTVAKVSTPTPAAPPKPTCIPVGVELLDEPLEAVEVIKIKVKKLEHDGTLYWLDTDSMDLYENGRLNSVGKKIGTWNPDEESIESEFA